MSNPNDSSLAARPTSRRRIWLAALFVLAFSLRLVANEMFEGLHEGPNPGAFGADAVEFNTLAVNLARGNEYAIEPGMPTSFRAPGFPFALAAVYSIAGADNYLAARLFFCLTGALLVIVVFFLARESLDETAALFAAALVAIYPNLIYYSIHFASEPLYTLLLAASALAFLRAVTRSSLNQYLLSGSLLGLAALTRPVALFFFPFFALAAVWVARNRFRATLLKAAFYCAAVLLVVAPWTARNYLAHGRLILVASNGGSTFWGSNNHIVLTDPAHQGDWVSTERLGPQKEAVRALTREADRDRLEWGYGKQFLAENPGAVPRLLWFKLSAFWTPVPSTPNSKFNLIIALSYTPVLVLAAAGLLRLARRRGQQEALLLISAAVVSATVLSTLIFYGSARFRCTIEPFLIVFAGFALSALLKEMEPGLEITGHLPFITRRGPSDTRSLQGEEP